MIALSQPLPDPRRPAPTFNELPQYVESACRRIGAVTLADLVANGYARDIADEDPAEAVAAVLIVARAYDVEEPEILEAAEDAVSRMAAC